jgi:quinol monooxygenase YgiN
LYHLGADALNLLGREIAVIVVAGYFDVAEADRRAFLDSKAAQAAHTLEETGCREYAFSADAAHPGRVRLIELWDSMDDLAAHLAAHRASGPAPSPVAVLSTQFQVFEGTPTQFPSA